MPALTKYNNYFRQIPKLSEWFGTSKLRFVRVKISAECRQIYSLTFIYNDRVSAALAHAFLLRYCNMDVILASSQSLG